MTPDGADQERFCVVTSSRAGMPERSASKLRRHQLVQGLGLLAAAAAGFRHHLERRRRFEPVSACCPSLGSTCRRRPRSSAVGIDPERLIRRRRLPLCERSLALGSAVSDKAGRSWNGTLWDVPQIDTRVGARVRKARGKAARRRSVTETNSLHFGLVKACPMRAVSATVKAAI
jgi:hypothetical protein